jgi:hypothetical protein
VPLKPTIFHGVSADSVASRVSREFKTFVDVQRLNVGSYTVIAFPGMRGESTSIVDSKVMARSLAKAKSSGEPIVTVAHNFTAEARAMLDAIGAQYFSRSDFYWSDASWSNIRDGR